MVKVYRINGTFGQKGNKQKFTIDLRATTPEQAKEKIYTDIGSRQRVKRFLINIESIKEIKPEDTISLVVEQLNEVK